MRGERVGGLTKVAAIKKIKLGEGKLVETGGKKMALFNVGGEFFAIEDTCPHRGGPLSEGTLEGDEVSCPWHAATFNIKTGEVTGGPVSSGVKSYKVQVQGNDILIELP